MSRADVVLVALLLIAVGEAGTLAWRSANTPPLLVPLLLPGDPPGALGQPGGSAAVLRARGASIGTYITIEDLARGALAATQDELPGVPALSAAEKARLVPLIAQARRHRDELLEREQAAQAAAAAMDASAREILATLSPEQRAWVLAHRDEVSVAGVEDEYWTELTAALAAP